MPSVRRPSGGEFTLRGENAGALQELADLHLRTAHAQDVSRQHVPVDLRDGRAAAARDGRVALQDPGRLHGVCNTGPDELGVQRAVARESEVHIAL